MFNLSPCYLPPSPISPFLLQGKVELCPTNVFVTHWNKRAGKTGSWYCAFCVRTEDLQRPGSSQASPWGCSPLTCCLPACAVGQAPGCTLPAAASSPLCCTALIAVFSPFPIFPISPNVKSCVQLHNCSFTRSRRRHGRVWACYL